MTGFAREAHSYCGCSYSSALVLLLEGGKGWKAGDCPEKSTCCMCICLCSWDLEVWAEGTCTESLNKHQPFE